MAKLDDSRIYTFHLSLYRLTPNKLFHVEVEDAAIRLDPTLLRQNSSTA